MSTAWKRENVVDRGSAYSDWHTDEFVCAQGYDERSRRSGSPWTLFRKHNRRWLRIDSFATLSAAQRAAEEI